MSLRLSYPPTGDPPRSDQIHEIYPRIPDSSIEYDPHKIDRTISYPLTPKSSDPTQFSLLPPEFKDRLRSVISRSANPRKTIDHLRSKFAPLLITDTL